MVVSPGGWRSTRADFFKSRSCNDVRLYSFGDDDDEVRELPLDSLSLSPLSSSSSSQEKDNVQLQPNHVSHHPQGTESVSRSRILVLETRGDSTDLSGTASTQLSERDFQSVCSRWGFSRHFRERMARAGALPRFEYALDEPEREDYDHQHDDDDEGNDKGDDKGEEPSRHGRHQLNALEIGFSWGPGHGNFVVALGKYSFVTRTLHLFLSSNGVLEDSGWISNSSISSDLLGHQSISSLISLHKATLRKNPLTLMPLLLECCERLMDIKAQRYNLRMLQIGTAIEALYPTAFADWFKSWRLNSSAGSEQNALLFDCYNDVKWSEKNCRELLGIAERYLWLAEELEKICHERQRQQQQRQVTRRARVQTLLPQELVRSVHHRTSDHSHMLEYLENMITTQFNVQYNHLVQKDAEVSIQISRATKKDGESMKTIAYLTLFFLPVTFVCAIFSTTVFNFENWDLPSTAGLAAGASASARVVSQGWWVFVLSCAVAMVGTIGAWVLLVVRNRKEGG